MHIFFNRQAYRLAGSFNNFHGRLTAIFHLLSDDKVGSTPRFAPGSKAVADTDMEVTDETVDDEVAIVSDKGGPSKHTPLRGANTVKRKAGELFSGSDSGSGSASKIRPT
jgi:hypothetical protein